MIANTLGAGLFVAFLLVVGIPCTLLAGLFAWGGIRWLVRRRWPTQPHLETNATVLASVVDAYRHAVVVPTLRCTLACPQCMCRHAEYRPEMTWSQYERIVDSLGDQASHLRRLTFTGGEPTLWPYLPKAIALARARGLADRIVVISNGLGREPNNYRGADKVYFTHYGAQNAYDLLRLKQKMGRRAVIRHMVHYSHVVTPTPNNMPAVCGCASLTFLGDRVYGCSVAAVCLGGFSVRLGEDYYRELVNRDPHMQPECRRCLWNQKNAIPDAPGIVLQASVWDSRFSWMWELPGRDKQVRLWLRKLGWFRK